MRRTAAVTAILLAAALAAATSSHAASAEPPRGSIAVIGDYGSGTASERAVARLVAKAQPTAVVTTGDNVYDDADYDRRVGDYYGSWVAEGRLFPALGNHDHDEGVDAYDDYFSYLKGLRAYTRIVDEVQFYVIDSDSVLHSEREHAWQRNWLARAVPRSKARWQVVVLHHPPFSSGSVHGSTEQLQWPYRSWGVDLVLSGHEHQYERIRRDGLTYVVDGAGGKDLYAFGKAVVGSRVRVLEFGALFLRPTADSLIGEFWTAEGRRADIFRVVSTT